LLQYFKGFRKDLQFKDSLLISDSYCPEVRYLAVTGAHITHMLHDTIEDTAAGYFNIPSEYFLKHHISLLDVQSQAYRQWVYRRVQLARGYFQAGRACLAQTRSLRCRLAGYAYTARFEWILGAIECDHFCLHPAYSERKGPLAGMWVGWSTLASLFRSPSVKSRIS
jgi:hypothetical protein